MNKVRDAINESDLEGVSVSVIHDTSTTARLVIKGSKTVSEKALDLTEINGSNILRKLKYLTNGGNKWQTTGTNDGFLQQNTADLDALLNVDSVDIVKGTNEISDIIDGVTFKLLRAQETDDSPLTITITNDTTSAKAEIETFIEKYNAAITYLNEKAKVDTTNFIRGEFRGLYRRCRLYGAEIQSEKPYFRSKIMKPGFSFRKRASEENLPTPK